jgi:hypothetical protein
MPAAPRMVPCVPSSASARNHGQGQGAHLIFPLPHRDATSARPCAHLAPPKNAIDPGLPQQTSCACRFLLASALVSLEDARELVQHGCDELLAVVLLPDSVVVENLFVLLGISANPPRAREDPRQKKPAAVA